MAATTQASKNQIVMAISTQMDDCKASVQGIATLQYSSKLVWGQGAICDRTTVTIVPLGIGVGFKATSLTHKFLENWSLSRIYGLGRLRP